MPGLKKLDKQDLLEVFYWLKFIRAFDERVSRLYRQGKILGGVYSAIGQEAVIVGTCYPLRPGDVVFPLHRDLGAFLMRGVEPKVLMAQLMGKATGLSRGKDSYLHGSSPEHGVFGSTSMLGSSLPVAAGSAMAFQLQGKENVAVAFFGEGASNRGDFHEGLNLSGVWKLPVVFVCENNLYAYSTPVEAQMAIEDVADRAASYGFPGVVVSGNDLNAVYRAVGRALERARGGGRTHPHRVQDLPLPRPLGVRQGHLPGGDRTRRVEGQRPPCTISKLSGRAEHLDGRVGGTDR